MKIKMAASKMLIMCIGISILGAVLLFCATMFIFLQWPWDWRQPMIIIIWGVSTILLFIFSFTKNYFILEKNFICHHKYSKEMYYHFKDIIYIDQDYARKHKTILFVTNKGDIRYIPFDKENKLYQAMLERCKNLISYHELIVKYPNAKKIDPPKSSFY